MRRTVRRAGLNESILSQLREFEITGTFKKERILTSPQSSKIRVGDATFLNFCANNYLGLSDNALVIDAAKAALTSHGFGMSSVRFICGTTDLHKQLEKRMAELYNKDDCIAYPSCFDANGGVFEAILGPEDVVISDALNHASIIDGIRLCKAKRLRYDHLNMESLEEQLRNSEGSRIRLIVTDGVFSMDGDVAPLDRIVQLAKLYKANIFVDDCHGTGVIGPGGRGTPALFNVVDDIDIINTTFGKALGGASGGATIGSASLVSLLRQKGRPYLFSNSMPPAVVAGSLKALDMIFDEAFVGGALARLSANTTLFRTEMTRLGFTISGHKDCPIAPVMLGDSNVAATMARAMMERGVYVTAFSFPVVPRGQARIRVQLSAAHSKEDIEKTMAAFAEVKATLKL